MVPMTIFMTFYSNNMNLYLKYERYGLVNFEIIKCIHQNPSKGVPFVCLFFLSVKVIIEIYV